MASAPITLKRYRSSNEGFGALIEDVRPEDLVDPRFRRRARETWSAARGLLAVRGAALAGLSPEALVAWAEVFGRVDRTRVSGRESRRVAGQPILRIGNVRDAGGHLISTFARVPAVRDDAGVRYDPVTRRPVWHTDSTFLPDPPIGSVFHCRQAPPEGGDTLFADTREGYATLDTETRGRLRRLEAVCSLAHHDKKISLYTPGYPTLDARERAANPPNRVPLVLRHPVTGAPALYGLNSSTCCIVERGAPVSRAAIDRYDLEGLEDESVQRVRDLLPHLTGPEFTIRWRWRPGDIVVWDNRCTMHAATGFDDERHTREMWRVTLLSG